MPEDVDGWLERLPEMLEELDPKTVLSAYKGDEEAKAVLQAWAVEMQAACIFLASYTGALQADAETLVEAANTILDAVQAILLAIGILWLLKRLKKKRNKKGVLEITVTEKEFRSSLGSKTNPIPQATSDKTGPEEAAYLKLRIDWTIHFLLTMFQAMKMQSDPDLKPGQELQWKAHLDAKTCSICRYMHGKKSVNGDFLPIIIKQFPKYRPFVGWMGYPHAHPRCRCVAVVV